MTSETSHADPTTRPWSRGGPGRAVAAETSAANLLDSLSEVVFRTDAEGRWTYLNRAWTTLTGYDVGPSLGARFLDYVHPDEVEYTTALFMGVVRGGTDHCHHETRYRTRHGGYRRVQIRANVLRGPSGEVLGNTGTILDVTDSRLGAEVVGEHATLLELVTAGTDPEELPTGVAVYDRDLRLRRGSPVVDRLVGAQLHPGDPLDRLVELLRPADWRARSLGGDWGLVGLALRTRRAQLGDLELAGERGTGRALRASVIPFDQGGEELAALVLSDITDLRRAERQQAGLARLGQRALAELDIPTLLAEAVDLVTATLDVAVCDVIRREPPDGDRADRPDGAGLPDGPDRAGLPDGSATGPALGSATGPAAGPALGSAAGSALTAGGADGPGVGVPDPGYLARLTDPAAPTAPTQLGTGPIYLTGTLAAEASSLVHLALGADEPVVANELGTRPHLRSGWSDAGGAQAALAARIGSARAPFGVLAAASTRPRRFTGEEARFLQSVANILGAAIDRDRAERHSRQLYEEAQRGRAWLAASAEITAGALVAGQSQQALMLLASLARGVTSADVGAVALPDEAGNLVATEVDSAPHRHSDPETLHGIALALDAAENRPEFQAGRPVYVADLDASDAWSGPIALTGPADTRPDGPAGELPGAAPTGDLAAGDLTTGDRAAGGPTSGPVESVAPGPDGPLAVAPPIPPDPRLREALVIPLIATDKPLGALVLGNSTEGVPFAGNDPELAGAFANDAALALQLAEAHRERARFAVFEDRERIARDLHDLVIQRLFAIGLHLQSLTRAVGDVTAARLNAAINGLDSTIDDIRRTIFKLQPTPVGA
ncbi:PAS domain-containing protein [Parafrankia discariae]|uniref:PAS domain-containing protein n=1 Tax=Parafrankia discariae TaxID=365528 RepID=UPI0003A78BC6|nr:PAS domain-containing protein [Parafrankia discariae]